MLCNDGTNNNKQLAIHNGMAPFKLTGSATNPLLLLDLHTTLYARNRTVL